MWTRVRECGRGCESVGEGVRVWARACECGQGEGVWARACECGGWCV